MTEILNVFVDNTPGRIKSVTETLARENVNIIAFAVHDKGEFGLMKLVATEPERAKLILAENGFACALREAMVVAVPDKPGNLNELTGILLEHGINISGIFGFVIEGGQTGICCLETSQPVTKALQSELEQAGFRILTSMTIF
jgi:hypothetical protein